MTKRRRIKFTMATRKNENFSTGSMGKAYRFTWQDLYRALLILKNHIANIDLVERIDRLLGSTRDIVEYELWIILQLTELDPNVRTNTVLACGWVLACYGYYHGLTTHSDSSWPLPRELRRVRKLRIHDWRVDLVCPLCGKPYRIPGNVKAKDKVLRRFGSWLEKHIKNDPH